MCGVWRDFRILHNCCDGRAQVQPCCQASLDNVKLASLELASALYPHEPGH